MQPVRRALPGITPHHLPLLLADDVDAAFHHITAKLLSWEAAQAAADAAAAQVAATAAQAALLSARALAARASDAATAAAAGSVVQSLPAILGGSGLASIAGGGSPAADGTPMASMELPHVLASPVPT